MEFPFRSPRLARDAGFSARDPNQELPVYDPDADSDDAVRAYRT